MCLWVLIGHTCKQTGMNLPVLRSPRYAVDGFMLLSGFLMTYHALLRSGKEPWTHLRTWIAFYVRRYFRISPLYYLLLIPAYLLAGSFSRWRTATDRFLGVLHATANVRPFGTENLFVHLTYVFGLLPTYHWSTILPDWSLSLEMQFYLVFPFFMLLIFRFGWLLFSLAASGFGLAAILCAPHLAAQFRQPSPLPFSLLWFVIGMLWASAFLASDPSRARRKILFAAALSLLSRDPHDIVLVAAFAWVLFAERRFVLGTAARFTRRILSGQFSARLARASYSVYLTHLLILTPLAYWLALHLELAREPRFLVALIVTLALSYGIAQPLELLENWGIAQGKRLSQKWGEPSYANRSENQRKTAARHLAASIQ